MARRPPLPRTVWVLGIVSLLMDLSSEIYHALLPAFLTVTLGLPVAAVGALDGIAEATANIAKLVSGRFSDRQARRKPWVLAGYGLAALSKPLFPLAGGASAVLGARFLDRIGKGLRGAPRDAMIADETPAEQRGAAFGLRQSLDTAGAFLAPLLAVALMALFLGDIRTVFWIAAIPAGLAFLVALLFLHETGGGVPIARKARWGGLAELDRPVKALLVVGFAFGLARFSESFLILKAMAAGLAPTWSPLVLALFNFVFLLFAYPAGAISDRVRPRNVLLVGIALLVAADLWLAVAEGLVAIALGVALWGGHMALTQGVLSRMIADAAGPERRATSFGAFFFVSGVAALLSSVVAGLLWDSAGPGATYLAAAGAAALSAILLFALPTDAAGTAASGPPPHRP